MNKEKENLNELLRKFYDKQQADAVSEDIFCGDKIFSDNPPPQPSSELIKKIKVQVEHKLSANKKQRAIRHYLRTAAAVAAAVLITFILLQLPGDFHEQPGEEIVIDNTQEVSSWEMAVADNEFELLAAQVEELEDEIFSLEAVENGLESESIDELEIELMEINSDFWKG